MSIQDFPDYDFREGIIALALLSGGMFLIGLGVGWLIWG